MFVKKREKYNDNRRNFFFTEFLGTDLLTELTDVNSTLLWRVEVSAFPRTVEKTEASRDVGVLNGRDDTSSIIKNEEVVGKMSRIHCARSLLTSALSMSSP